MRAGMERIRSAQRHASAASIFVEMPWVPLKLLFWTLLKDTQKFAKMSKISNLHKIRVWAKIENPARLRS